MIPSNGAVWHDFGVADADSDRTGLTARADAALEAIEKVVYLGIAALLLVASVVLLAIAGKVLVDVLGFTIVIPLLSLYAEKFGASPLVATLIVSCYAASSLVSTPILGKLSDQ